MSPIIAAKLRELNNEKQVAFRRLFMSMSLTEEWYKEVFKTSEHYSALEAAIKTVNSTLGPLLDTEIGKDSIDTHKEYTKKPTLCIRN